MRRQNVLIMQVNFPHDMHTSSDTSASCDMIGLLWRKNGSPLPSRSQMRSGEPFFLQSRLTYFISRLTDSSASSDRRVPRWRGRASMKNSRGKGYLIAAPVVRLSTRVHRSLIVGVDGLRLPKGNG